MDASNENAVGFSRIVQLPRRIRYGCRSGMKAEEGPEVEL